MEESEKLNFLSTLFPLSVILFIVVLGVLLLNQQFNRKLFRQKLEREELKMKQQQELLRSSIEVQEKERKRIAADLHDELGAALSMIRMHLLRLERLENGSEIREVLPQVRAMNEAALASMRRISHEIRPPQLEAFGLVRTLEVTAERIIEAGQLNMTVSVPDSFPRFPMAIELGLYRVSMELITNTVKHGNASHIEIALSRDPEQAILSYSDDGQGLPEAYDGRGLGHQSIEARANALGGTFTIRNGNEKGLHATIKIPFVS